MLFKKIKILDENFKIKENMYVATEGDKISFVGESMPEGRFGEEVDGGGKLLMPAFYNAHGHSPMSLLRGYAENMSLNDWLFKKVFPFEDKLNSEAVYYGTLLSIAESLRFGIVSTSDMYYFMDDMAAAYIESGSKGNLSRGISFFDDSDPWDSPRLKEMKSSFEKYHGAESGRIKMDVCIHAEYTSTPAAVLAVSEYGKKVGAIMHVHISESKEEHEACKERRNGLTPIRYFNSLGVLDIPVLAAHCVWVDDEDMNILKAKNVTVASNPISNMKLSSGVCNVPELLRRGIRVAIGTDSVSSNNSLNFFEEIKCFAIASKMYFNDPTALTPGECLYGATRAGALAQGREDAGLLKEGFKADLIMLDVNQPNMVPVHDMLNNLVYSASGSDIKLTMCDGKVLYRDGKYITIDIEKTMYEASRVTAGILSRL